MKKQAGILAVIAALGLQAHAQTWIGGSGNNWNTPANWSGGAVPAGGPTTAVTFDGTALSFTPNLDVPASVNSMSITSAGYSFSTQPLTFFGTAPVLTVTQPGTSFANPIHFNSNTTISNTHPLTFTGGIAGSASFTKTGAGTLVLSGSTWHNGSAIVAAGTLQVGDGVNVPLNIGAIVNGSAVVINTGFLSVDLAGAMTGSGTLTITSGGDVRHASAAPLAHQGTTTVNGHLRIQGGGMSSNGALVLGPSGLFTVMADAAVGSVTGPATATLSIASTLVTGSDDSSTTYAGFLSGSGNIRKVGAGTFTVTSNNWVSGSLAIDAGSVRIGDGSFGPNALGSVSVDGTLELDKSTGAISIPGPVTGTGDIWIKPGTSIDHLGAAPFTHQGLTLVDGLFNGGFPSAIDNNGPVVISSTGRLNLSGSATVGSIAGSGRIDNSGAVLTVGGDNTSTTISGLLSGTGDFRKVGSGTLTVSSPNSWFDGDTTVEAPGTLQFGNGTQGPTVVRALVVNGTFIVDAPSLGLNGSVTGLGTFRVQPGSAAFNFAGTPLSHQGPTIVNGTLDSSSSILSIDNNSALVIGPGGVFVTRSGNVGSIAGFGTFNASNGTFVAGGDNTSTTFAGTILGNAQFRKTGSGTFTLATTSFFGGSVIVEAPGALRLGDGSTGPTATQDLVVDGALLFNTPTIFVNGSVSGNGTVTVQAGSTVNYNGVFPMTHAGTTIVSGQLNSSTVAAVSNGSPLLLSGGLLTRGGMVGSIAGGGNLQLAAGGTFTTGGNNVPATFAGTISGTGALVKAGTGVFTLSGSSPAYNGPIQVGTGTLNVTGTLGTAGLTVVTGAALMGTGTITGPVNVEIGGTLAPGASPGTLTTGNFSLAGTLQVEVLGTAPGTQHDRIAANGTVTLNGGTLVLSGAYVPVTGNTFTIIANDGTDPVVGTFAGLPEGATIALNGASLRISYVGGTGNDVVLSLASYVVTPSAGANGSISPNTAQTVAPGGFATFTVTPNAGYSASVGGTCGGTLTGTTYTTNAVNADCTVVANFSSTTLTVTPGAGANGTISPSTPQPVAPGGTLTFTVTPSTGYLATVGGTCGGNLVGTTYTTNPVTANCTVLANFTLASYTVTPSAGPNGTISPSTPQTVPGGSSLSFTVTPDSSFRAVVGGTCGGSMSGSIYTTNAITASCTVAVTFELVNPPRMVNISTRMQVLTGDDALIGGFVIGGSTNKTVAVVATGPSLASFGITNALANPTMILVRSSDQTVVATNNDWQTASNASLLQAAGLAPSNPLESAIYVNLAPGAYTAVVQGVGGGTGIGMIAVYEVDEVATPLINISTRGRVQTGNDVMIGGFIISGQSSQAVAIVGTGPSLSAFGIANPLANPTLTLIRSSDQAVIATNDDWQSGCPPGYACATPSQLTAAGFAPSNPLESAIYITLPPGAYTAILSGVANGTGVGVIGVYKAP